MKSKKNNIFYTVLIIITIISLLSIAFITSYSYIYEFFHLSNDFEELKYNWKFEFYQQDELVETSTINLPFDISQHISYKKGKVILSKTIDFSKYKNPALRLGKLSDAVEIYLNDILIHEYGKKGNIIFSAFNFDKTIPLIKIENKEKEYELKIVLFILTNVSVRSPFYLGEYDDLALKSNLQNFFNVKLKRFLFLIIFAVTVIFFYIGIKEKRKDLKYFSFCSLFVMIFSLNQLFEYLPINYLVFNYIFVYKSMYLMAIFFFISFFYLVNININKVSKIFVILFSIFFVIDLVLVNNYNLRRMFYTYELFIGIISFLYLVFYVYKNYFYDKKIEFKKYIFPFTILFLTIINDILVFVFPAKYPQFYMMIYGFEIYILILSRIILNQLIETYIVTNNKNIEITNSNEKLKNYLDSISSSINLLKSNSQKFEETSKDLTTKSLDTKSQILRLNDETKLLTDLNNRIHNNDIEIIKISEKQINLGNELRELIEQNSNNFNYMKNNLNITKEFSTQIDEISKQTALLGLNASIESTKSAEYFKSFSVVASEVKNLASKSSELVSKIKNITDDVMLTMQVGIESSIDLSNYFEKFYINFQDFMNILQQNQQLHKGIEENFKDISLAIEQLSKIIDNLTNLADELKKQVI